MYISLTTTFLLLPEVSPHLYASHLTCVQRFSLYVVFEHYFSHSKGQFFISMFSILQSVIFLVTTVLISTRIFHPMLCCFKKVETLNCLKFFQCTSLSNFGISYLLEIPIVFFFFNLILTLVPHCLQKQNPLSVDLFHCMQSLLYYLRIWYCWCCSLMTIPVMSF